MQDCLEEWLEIAHSCIDKRDVDASYTVGDLRTLGSILCSLKTEGGSMRRLLDLGCGFGGLATAIAKFIGIKDVQGVDINDERIQVARSRMSRVERVNLDYERLPFDSGSADLITSFGVLEHLSCWDNALSEAHRVLKYEGLFIVSIPNLRSYLQILSLLLGYQPRDIEVSKKFLVGVLPVSAYTTDVPAGHLHTMTLRAFKALLSVMGFDVTLVKPLRNRIDNRFLDILDRVACASPSTARRFVVVAKKRHG